jgi:hypothetical protein
VTPRVWNKRDPSYPAEAVYIGRPTKWGNPFVIGHDGTRDVVIARYKAYLLERSDLYVAAKTELRGKHLLCWCAPQACHGDVLLAVANECERQEDSQETQKERRESSTHQRLDPKP